MRDLLEAHGLELQVGHRAGRVLRERLVDADADLGSGRPFTHHEVLFDDLARETLARHTFPPGYSTALSAGVCHYWHGGTVAPAPGAALPFTRSSTGT